MESERSRKSRLKYEETVRSRDGRVIEAYVDDTTKVEVECARKHRWKASPANTKRGHWCKKCSGHCPEEARERFELIIFQRKAKSCETYKTAHVKLKIICKNDHEFMMYPDKVKQGQWCECCPKENFVILYQSIEYSTDCKKEFEEIIKQRKWVILGVYNRNCDKVLMRCDAEHEFKMAPSSIRRGDWCYKCAMLIDESKAKLEVIVSMRGGKMLEDYVTNQIHSLFQCQYGHFWRATPNNIKQGRWCRVCNESKLEREARLFLEQMNVYYISQYSFNELPRKSYDFYFYYANKHYLLEVDGLQHFEYREFFHKNIAKFEYCQIIDNLKTFAALEFGYQLIRVDHTQINSIGQHVINAIQNDQSLYLSDVDMYEYLKNPILPEVTIKHCPTLAIKYNLIPHCGDAILEIIG